MTESKPLMEMDPAPSEQSTQSRMFSSGLSAPGQSKGHFCLSFCEPVLIFSFNFFLNLFLILQKAFNALCHSTHLYGRRLVLEWADTEETLEALRRRTAEHFHGNSCCPGTAPPGTAPPGMRCGLAGRCWSLRMRQRQEASRPGLCLTALPVSC